MVSLSQKDISDFRAFNRFYTRRVGLLNDHLDASPFSLTEARILYEIANWRDPTAADIARELGIDPGQMSRALKRFEDQGLLRRAANPCHGKQQLLELTRTGALAFAELDAATVEAVSSLLDNLPETDRVRLLRAIGAVKDVLGTQRRVGTAFHLRPPQPGDLGLITARQAILYAEEYGWDWTYEALVAKILAGFVETFDPACEYAWVAEMDGSIVGSIFLMRGDEPGVAKLRLLYVEPSARGHGIGKKLVDACINRAREAGYRRLDLWTNSVLVSARRIYEAIGFALIDEAPHQSFGQDLVGQIWSLDLQSAM